MFQRGTREWLASAVLADAMALLVIRLDKAGIPELTREGYQPQVCGPLGHQSKALMEVIALLVPESDAEALWMHLVNGNSALHYPTYRKKERR